MLIIDNKVPLTNYDDNFRAEVDTSKLTGLDLFVEYTKNSSTSLEFIIEYSRNDDETEWYRETLDASGVLSLKEYTMNTESKFRIPIDGSHKQDKIRVSIKQTGTADGAVTMYAA